MIACDNFSLAKNIIVWKIIQNKLLCESHMKFAGHSRLIHHTVRVCMQIHIHCIIHYAQVCIENMNEIMTCLNWHGGNILLAVIFHVILIFQCPNHSSSLSGKTTTTQAETILKRFRVEQSWLNLNKRLTITATKRRSKFDHRSRWDSRHFYFSDRRLSIRLCTDHMMLASVIARHKI